MIAETRFLGALRRLIVLAGVGALGTFTLLAQTGANTGLRGRITDPSGASVPNVQVTLTQTDTGEQRVVTSNELGDWQARFLSPGRYQLAFEVAGFKKLTHDGVNVSTAEMAAVDVAMQVGDVVETVEVRADAEMVQTNSATIVRSLDQRELESLPTSSRNFTQLLVIEPGVSADISELLSNNNASISPSVNGSRTTSNSLVYNGVDVTNLLCCSDRINGARGTIDEGGGTLSRNIAPAPETLSESSCKPASTTRRRAATAAATSNWFLKAAPTSFTAASIISSTGRGSFHQRQMRHTVDEQFLGFVVTVNACAVERGNSRRVAQEQDDVPGGLGGGRRQHRKRQQQHSDLRLGHQYPRLQQPILPARREASGTPNAERHHISKLRTPTSVRS
jgi:hypothetical protein